MRDRRRQARPAQKTRVPWWALGAVALVVVAVLGIVVYMSRDKGGGSTAQSEPERVGPLEVSATKIDLGYVPLNKWVDPTFRLSNVTAEPVTMTIPRQGVEVLEGC